jgi:hypothetical protein
LAGAGLLDRLAICCNSYATGFDVARTRLVKIEERVFVPIEPPPARLNPQQYISFRLVRLWVIAITTLINSDATGNDIIELEYIDRSCS